MRTSPVLVLVMLKAPLLAYLLLFTALSVGYVVCSSVMLRRSAMPYSLM